MQTVSTGRARRARQSSHSAQSAAAPAAIPQAPDRRVVRAARASIDALEDRVLLSTTLAPVADAYVWQNQPTSNFGTAATLEVKDSSSTNDRWSYVRFDLTGVDSVADARLRLNGHVIENAGSTADVSVLGYSSTDVTWGESAITWNNKPAANTTTLGTDTVTYNNNTDQWYEWDVSSYVAQQKAAGATAVTFVLEPGNTTDSKASFNSREAAANQPQLVVTPDSGTTTTTAVAATADAYTRDGTYASQNFGSANPLVTKQVTTADSGFNRDVFVSFDSSSVAGNVTSAKVRLYGSIAAGSGTESTPVRIYAVTDPSWAEGSLTWSNQSTYGIGTTALSSVTVPDATARCYEWDVTSHVNSERAAGRNVVGFMVKADVTASTVFNFNSREAASNAPELSVTTNAQSAPAAATGLTATALGGTRVGLSWNDNSSDETGFEIDRSTDPNFVQNVTTLSATADATDYTDTGLALSTSYYYRVRDVNGAAASANTDVASATTTDGSPAVTEPASASAASGDTAIVIAVGAADDGGDENLTYTWTNTSAPAGATVVIADNDTNSAALTPVTVDMPGTYTFQVTVSNGTLSTTSSSTVTVDQKVGSLTIDQSSAALANGDSEAFSATVLDQFGHSMSTPLSWSVSGGGVGGTIDQTGRYSTSASGTGSDTLSVSAGGLQATTDVQVGKVAGTVFDDANGDQTRGTGEEGLNGWTVYLDDNKNGSLDAGELSTTTDSSGDYALGDVGQSIGGQCGTLLRVIQQSGWTETAPQSGAMLLQLAAGQVARGQNFGQQAGPRDVSVAQGAFAAVVGERLGFDVQVKKPDGTAAAGEMVTLAIEDPDGSVSAKATQPGRQRTDGNGWAHFTATALATTPAGTNVRLHATADGGGEDNTHTFTIDEPAIAITSTNPSPLTLWTNPIRGETKTGTFTVTVTNKSTGTPVHQVDVSARPGLSNFAFTKNNGGEGETDAAGTFTFSIDALSSAMRGHWTIGAWVTRFQKADAEGTVTILTH